MVIMSMIMVIMSMVVAAAAIDAQLGFASKKTYQQQCQRQHGQRHQRCQQFPHPCDHRLHAHVQRDIHQRAHHPHA